MRYDANFDTINVVWLEKGKNMRKYEEKNYLFENIKDKKEKLDKIKENDNNKFQLCQQKGISLCIIDTSSQKYVTESSSQKFLNIIRKIMQIIYGKREY